MLNPVEMFSSLRFFPEVVLNPSDVIQSIFQSLPKSINRDLKQAIVLNSLHATQQYLQQHGKLSKRDAALPKEWSLEKKLAEVAALRQKYYARPVLTAHPTEILSDDMQIRIQSLIKKALQLKSRPQGALVHQIANDIRYICEHSLLPAENLSPQAEMARQDRLYLDMMESFSVFNRDNIKAFARNHQVPSQQVEEILTKANKWSYQNVSSWVVADIDGNKKRTVEGMKTMESGLQLAILERYLARIEPLLQEIPQLQSAFNYLKRCQLAIRDGIYFSLKGAEIAKNRLMRLIKAQLALEPKMSQQLSWLYDLIDIVGMRGNLKQFVRQSSKANADVFENFVQILKTAYPEMSHLQHYAQWSQSMKAKLHHRLRTDSGYFKTIKSNIHLLSADSKRELDILEFVIEYQEQFSYILSDTENYTSLKEVVILFGFAAYRKNKLFINDIRCPPVLLIPLCETPEDLKNLPDIFDEMLSDPYMKQLIIDKGEMVYVAGPSDLGKEGGIFAHVDLIESEKNAKRVLEKHQALDPALKQVKIRVLYGMGSDFHRRVSDAFSQLFCTFQGSDACALGAYGSYQAYVENVSGRPSENSERALELDMLEKKHPDDYAILKQVVSRTVKGYRDFIFDPASLELFKRLTIPYQLGILTNTSSRGEAKNSAPKDINKSRAIGMANYDIASLFMMRIFMSADALVDLPASMVDKLPNLYQASSVLREQVLKTLFAIAVCDEQRALKKIFGHLPTKPVLESLAQQFIHKKQSGAPRTVEESLAYAICRLPRIMHALLGFFAPATQINAEMYLQKERPIPQQALGLIEQIGNYDLLYHELYQEIKNDLLPRYRQLATCLDAYGAAQGKVSKEEMAIIEENVVLALRGDKNITAGPVTLAKMTGREHPMPEIYQLRAKL